MFGNNKPRSCLVTVSQSVEGYSKGVVDVKSPSLFNLEICYVLEELQEKTKKGIRGTQYTEGNTKISLLSAHRNRGASNLQ